MEENKLSEELRHCLEGNGCVDCSCYEPKSVLTCRGLLQKAYETVKEHEEIYEIMRPLAERLNEFTALEEQGKLPCEIGHRVYMIYQFWGKGAWEIEEHKIRLEDLENIGKTVFLTRQEAEDKMAEMEGKK